MARRRSRKSSKGGKVSRGRGRKSLLPFVIGGAFLAAIAAFVVFKPSSGPAPEKVSAFRINEYREKGGSTCIGNRYTLEGKVENIVSMGNDRLVSVSLRDNVRERLPLLVKDGSAVNLSRGDSFLFEVECITGKDAGGQPVKGIMVVKNVSIK